MIVRKPFYFLRHAETEHNILQLCAGGTTDSLLTELGIAQAKQLQQTLAAINIKHVVASPLKRTQYTAKLATNNKHPIKLDAHLREWDLGDYEKMPIPDFKEIAKDITDDTVLPNGESRQQFATRVVHSLNHWLTQCDDLLLVSHGLVYMTIAERINQPGPMIGNAQLVHFYPTECGWKVEPV